MRARRTLTTGLAIVAGVALSCANAFAEGMTPVADGPAKTITQLQPVVVDNDAMVQEAIQSLGLLDGQIVRLDVPTVPQIAFSTVVPIDGQAVMLDLHPHSIRAENYQLKVQIADGSFVYPEPGPVRTMRGTIRSMPETRIAANLNEEGLVAQIIMADGTTRWIEPVGHRVANGEMDHYIVYKGEDVIPNGGSCATNHDPQDFEQQPDVDRGGACASTICVTQLACDADFEYFQDWGSINAVENRINSVINTVNNQYESEVNITHEITTIIVRTSEPDPYSSTNSSTLLGQFRSEWLNNQGGVPRDVAKLFTGKSIDGSVIGQAWTIGGICTTSAYCHSQSDCCGSFACTTDLAAHELGHLWGAFHCSCPGNTMNPSITCTNNFSSGTINSISDHRDSRTCLTPLESGTTSLPFFDNFPSTTINASLWIGNDGADANSGGNGEPSSPNSLNIQGSEELRSAYINTSLADNVTVSYWWQRTGSGNSPEPGEDLFVEYFDIFGNWVTIQQIAGSGGDNDPYQFESFNLPNSAEHLNFRIRFRGTSSNAGFDDYFIDDVAIDADLALPGTFGLLAPANGATGISVSPFFDWEDSPNASTYNLQVDDNSNFSSPIIDVFVLGSAANIGGSPLTENTQYFWRVFAENTNGSQISTPTSRSFTTETGGGGSDAEIRLERGSFSINDGGSHDHGDTFIGFPLERAYRYYNDGTEDLIVSNLSVPAGYTITKQPPSPVPPGQSRAFKVELDADSQGTFAGTISFTTNDDDENPFNFTVTGFVGGIPDPAQARVERGSFDIPNGASHDHGSTFQGQPLERAYRIYNDGEVDLDCFNLQVPAGYTITKDIPNNDIVGGGSKTFKVELDATAPGVYAGVISFQSNDPDDSPYIINVTGEVFGPAAPPEIRMTRGSFDIVDGGTHDHGATSVGVPRERAYRIWNDGDDPIFLSNLQVPAGYTITKNLPNRVNGGTSKTYKVELDADSVGVFSGEMSFNNNDADENPFNFTVTGTVTGALAVGGPLADAGENPLSSAAADFNGDGKIDVLVSHAGGKVMVFNGDGTGRLTLGDVVSLRGNAGHAVAADLNSDGRPDALIATDKGVAVLINDGELLQIDSVVRLGANPVRIAAADVNDDGAMDVIAIGEDGVLVTLAGDASGAFAAIATVEAAAKPVGLAIGHFNADRSIDAAILSDSGVVTIMINDGAGQLASVSGFRAADSGVAIAAGMINEDTVVDLAIADREHGKVTVYNGDGAGGFNVSAVYNTDGPLSDLAIADMNADGRADVVVAHRDDATITILVANDEGFFTGRETLPTGGLVGGLAAADVNADTADDIIVTLADRNQVAALMSAVGPRNPADLNADGTVDFIDLNTLLKRFGQPDGDIDGDNDADFDDLDRMIKAIGSAN
ncbi:MAG: choice-of-anchor D domain-containing protein [Phycisphaerales bacterium]